jgi:hypothetical protein
MYNITINDGYTLVEYDDVRFYMENDSFIEHVIKPFRERLITPPSID